MLLLAVLLLVSLVNAVNTACSNTKWSFYEPGQYRCYNRYYITGIQRGDNRGNQDYIDYLEGAQCCSAPPQWSNVGIQVVYAHWTHELDDRSAWANCPAGYFLQGLIRSDGHGIRSIKGFRCTKPSSHPFYRGDCYTQDITFCIDKKGLCSCKANYYITGLYRENNYITGQFCDDLNCLRALYCCRMAEKPKVVDEVNATKTRIMDTTLVNMVNLAHMLGYAWCSGCNAMYAGEDFYRAGDIWKANKKVLYIGNCDEYKSNQRLSLDFKDWRFIVKHITYGQSVVELLEQESKYFGDFSNNNAAPSQEELDITETVQSTITHSTTSSWSNRHELGISLDFNIPLIGGGSSISYKTAFEYSSTRVMEKSCTQGKSFTKKTSKTLDPFSAVRYEVSFSKVRTTIPYTATVIAQFSTEFMGFLRYDGGYASPTTNYHYMHKGSEDRPTFNYRFGGKSVPFYTALKKESEKQSRPWLWREMIKNQPFAKHFIDTLTEESQYEFNLTGILEYVAGTNINVLWKTVKLKDIKNITNIIRRDDTPLQHRIVLNGTHLAKSGPNDKPAEVQYPTVSLESSEHETSPIYANST